MSRVYRVLNLIEKSFPFVKAICVDAFRIASSPKSSIKSVYRISLYRNAIYLLSNSIILASTGFFFWVVAARFYSAESLGLASAMLAAIGLLAMLSTLGLDFAIIRFWHDAEGKSRDLINSCLTISVPTSIVLALIFVAGLSFWSPALLPIRDNPIIVMLFVITVVATALMTLVRQVFVAQRKAAFTLVHGLGFGLLRFAPLVLLVASFKAFGIFVSWGIAISLAVGIGILFLIPRIEPNYHPLPIVRKDLIRDMLHFSSTNYLAHIATLLPQFILPIMVVNLLGEEQNAYFYICWAIGNILFMIPISVSMSLFAEGSHNRKRLRHEVRRSFKLIALILVPAVLLLLLIGDKVLLLFGSAYSENATRLLWVLALSAIPLSVNHIYFGVKRVEMEMREVVALNWLMTIVILVSSYILLPRMGITWVGIAWLSTHVTVAALVVGKLFRNSVGGRDVSGGTHH